jgi:hypothetical protein
MRTGIAFWTPAWTLYSLVVIVEFFLFGHSLFAKALLGLPPGSSERRLRSLFCARGESRQQLF